MINISKVTLTVTLIFALSLNSFAQKESVKIKKLTQGADIILTGKVTHKKAEWNFDKTRIYTRTTLKVDEYLKGSDSENTVEVICLGGEIGEIGEIYSHTPSFENNEEVLVFLEKDKKSNHYKIMNGLDGKMQIINNENKNSKVSAEMEHIKSVKDQIKHYLQKE